MENSENEENNTTNQVNKTPPPSVDYSKVVYVVYTACIWIRISSGLGFKKKRVLSSILKTYLIEPKSWTPCLCLIS